MRILRILITGLFALTPLESFEYHIEPKEFDLFEIFPEDLPESPTFTAFSRNDCGNFAGYRVVGRWDRVEAVARIDGEDHVIYPGIEGSAFDINNANQVVGAIDLDKGATALFLWTLEQGAHVICGGPEDRAAYLIPYITDEGAIYATLDRGPTPDEDPNDYCQAAFTWDARRGVQELITLIPEDSGWEALTAVFIHPASGELVGYGIFEGEEAQYTLRKVDA